MNQEYLKNINKFDEQIVKAVLLWKHNEQRVLLRKQSLQHIFKKHWPFIFENLIATVNNADFIAQSKNKVDLNFYKVLPDKTSFLVAGISYLKNKDSWNIGYTITGFFEKKIPDWKDYKEYIEEYINKKNLQLK